MQTCIRISLENQGVALSATDNTHELLGYKAQDFISGKVTLQSLIHTNDQDIANILFSNKMQPATGAFNIRLRHADGRIRCITSQYNKTLNHVGAVLLDLILEDSKSIWLQSGDQNMMANFKAMMDSTDDYIYFKDRNHVFTGASETLVALTDPSEHWTDLVGKTDYDVFPEEYADIYYQLEKQVFSGTHVAHEYQETLDNNGNKGWVDNRKYSIKNDAGEIVGLFGIARDITANKLAEEAVYASMERFRTMIEQAPLGVALIDSFTGHIYEVNQKFANIAGRSLQDMSDIDWMSITHPDDVQEDLDNMARLNAGAIDNFIMNKRYIQPDGRYVWINMTIAPLKEKDGTHTRHLCMIEDITERKQLELKTKLISERSQHLLALESFSEQLTEKEFMQHGQELAENLTGSQIAFIHFVNDDEETIELVAWSRRTIEHYCHAAFDSHYPVSKAGIWADALREQQPVMFNDYATYPHKRGLPEGHSPLHRLISVPVIENGKVVMLTGVGNKETDYTETDIESVQLISNDIWRLVQRRRTENDQRVAATAFESQQGMFVSDANNIILRVNHAFTKITGYSADEVIGKSPSILSSGHHPKTYFKAMWQSINDTGTWEGEIWNRRMSGEVYPEYLTITVVKDIQGNISNYVASFMDITLSKAASEEIISLAFYDPLTHLPNRRLLIDRLNQALTNSARSGKQGALLFMDLDHFKTLNDTLGHDVGDVLLVQVAERLTATVRESDTVSRFGGDEFVVLLEDLSENNIEAGAQIKDVAEKIRLVLNQPYLLNTHTYHSTPSIGASLFNGHEHGSEELLKQADIAMYQSKNEGRNRFSFFDPKMQEAITARVRIEQELNKAIEQNQFELHYQIQVGGGKAIGAEALIRWQHPERGMISPSDFIPLAEESKLILSIGQWVLEAACAQIKLWQQNSLTSRLVISINISPKQFFQEDFVEQVLTTIERYAINPTKLKLELTESILIENINDIIAKMKALNNAGINFSLDDFGTGYSSLQYLKMLPISQLKIDQSFVRDINQDSNDRAIVVTIINMAQGLDLNVIAEGVQTEGQRRFLFDHGCMNYQGYLFGKPMPADMFEALLE